MHIREHKFLPAATSRWRGARPFSSLCKKWLIIILVEFGLVAFTITCVIYMSDNSSNVGDMCMIGVSSVPSHEWCINDDSEMALSLTRQRQTLALYMYKGRPHLKKSIDRGGGRALPEFFDPFFHHVVPYILTSISCYVILFGHF